ncbi:MAG: type 1 glutamine amidotransferase [Pseudomonadota bacterium]
MKPIAIFRHAATEGPGYLADFLDAHALPWQLIAIDAGAAVPHDVDDYAGLVFMGGPMSVNDDLPWIPRVLALIRQAVAQDVPVLGHCLGGQLMTRALGGTVTRNPVKEIGWAAVTRADNVVAHHWFGNAPGFEAFHWHGETFSLPPGATHLLSSRHCPHQAYAMGKHLALQCHVEMTAEMIQSWCAVGAPEISAAAGPAVQPVHIIQAQTGEKLPQLHAVARHIYQRWIGGLAG